MITAKLFRVSLLCAAALAASSCGILKKGKGPSTPVLGQRIAVLTGEGDVVVDPATTDDQIDCLSQIYTGQLGGDPWAILGTQSAFTGRLIGFDFVVDDDDNPSARVSKHQVLWQAQPVSGGCTAPFCNTGAFSTAQLVAR